MNSGPLFYVCAMFRKKGSRKLLQFQYLLQNMKKKSLFPFTLHCISDEDLLYCLKRVHTGSFHEEKAYSTPGKQFPSFLKFYTIFLELNKLCPCGNSLYAFLEAIDLHRKYSVVYWHTYVKYDTSTGLGPTKITVVTVQVLSSTTQPNLDHSCFFSKNAVLLNFIILCYPIFYLCFQFKQENISTEYFYYSKTYKILV